MRTTGMTVEAAMVAAVTVVLMMVVGIQTAGEGLMNNNFNAPFSTLKDGHPSHHSVVVQKNNSDGTTLQRNTQTDNTQPAEERLNLSKRSASPTRFKYKSPVEVLRKVRISKGNNNRAKPNHVSESVRDIQPARANEGLMSLDPVRDDLFDYLVIERNEDVPNGNQYWNSLMKGGNVTSLTKTRRNVWSDRHHRPQAHFTSESTNHLYDHVHKHPPDLPHGNQRQLQDAFYELRPFDDAYLSSSNRFVAPVDLESEFSNDAGLRSESLRKGKLRVEVHPPNELLISNSTGGRVDCRVVGTAEENDVTGISWLHEDGQPVTDVPGVVAVSIGGHSLVFSPAPPHPRFGVGIPAPTYSCLATTSMGALLSLPVTVRQVWDGPYEATASSPHVIPGNTAILTCSLPPHVRDTVIVSAWVRDDGFTILPSLKGDGRYHMMSSGSLHVLRVSDADTRASYRCSTRSTLSAAAQLSSPARITLAVPHGSVPPTLLESGPGTRTAVVGTDLALPCTAQGHPPPTNTWYKDGHRLPVFGGRSGVKVVGGALVLTSLVPSDSGEYRCVMNNTAGTATITTVLTVTSPLYVNVVSAAGDLTVGLPLLLRCLVTGGPVVHVNWYKDGHPFSSGRALITSDLMHDAPRTDPSPPSSVASLLRVGTAETGDAGAYQCRASSESDMAQGHVLVATSASAPVLLYRFIVHTLRPGPAVSLKCIALATPTPHVTWTLDGFPLSQSHRLVMGQFVSPHGDVISHVNISSVRVSDGGLYQCSAQNMAGSARHSARLNVYGPPTIRQMGQLVAVAGETFSVTCPAGGHPIDKITWTKDGAELPVNHHQRAYSNGTLTLKGVSRAADEGRYGCMAQDKQGRSDTGILELTVKVPPRLAQISFVGGSSAGVRTQATCLVLAGDPPISLHWTKNGRPLGQASTAVITQVNEFTSLLAIEDTSGEDSGNYTCFASNGAGKSGSSALFTVNVPPRWIIEPSDVSVHLGSSVDLQCKAAGSPPPWVTWSRQTTSGGWSSIASEGGGAFSASRGTLPLPSTPTEGSSSSSTVLTLNNVSEQHEGRFLCQAVNGVEPGQSKVVSVTVLEPPWFPDRPSPVEATAGAPATLVCRVRGDPPITVTWAWSGLTLSPSHKYRMQSDQDGESVTARLLVLETVSRDAGEYECSASNELGRGSTLLQLLVQDVPSPPSGLTAVEQGSRFVTLNWTALELGPAVAVDKYIVTYSSETAPSDTPSSVPALSPPSRVEGLLPATRYSFSVAAENRLGRSAPSGLVRVITLEEPPAGHPRVVKVVSVTSTSMRLRWEPPLANLTHGNILGYLLGQRENRFTRQTDTQPFNFSRIALPSMLHTSQELPLMIAPHPFESPIFPRGQQGGSVVSDGLQAAATISSVSVDGALETTLEGLRPHTPYALVLQAYNSRGPGPSSPTVTAITAEDRPTAPPQRVSCEALSPTSLRILWAPPPSAHVNGLITSYRVTYSPGIPDDDLEILSGFGSCMRAHSAVSIVGINQPPNSRGLAKDTHPGYRSPISDSTNFDGSSSTLLSSAKTLNHGEDVTSGHSPAGSTIVQGLTAHLQQLRPFTQYQVTVAAATEVGTGVSSDPVLCTTEEDVPSAPTLVKVVAAGPSSAIASWCRPASPNGRLSHYSVQWAPQGSTQAPNIKNVDAEFQHLELSRLPLERIEVWVTAHTRAGRGEESQRVATTPSTNVGAGVWSVGGPVDVPWKRDVTLDCLAVGVPAPQRSWTRYNKTLQLGSQVSISPAGSLRILDAQRDHSGPYTCAAANIHGSDSVTYQLRVIVPPAPPTLRVTETTPSLARLQWTVTDDGGAPVRVATLYYRAAGGETIEDPMVGSPHTVPGLRCGTLYHFFVTVRNAIGSSESSAVVEGRTKGRTPEAPPQFQFVTSNSSQATLYLTQWESGGCPITHFSVQYRILGGTAWTTVSSTLPVTRTFEVLGLEPGRRYELRVTAFNFAGAATADYTVTTPHADGAVGVPEPDNSVWQGGGASFNSLSRPTGREWADYQLLVPAMVSLVALALTLATVCICIKKKKDGWAAGNTLKMPSGKQDQGFALADIKLEQESKPSEEHVVEDFAFNQYISSSRHLGNHCSLPNSSLIDEGLAPNSQVANECGSPPYGHQREMLYQAPSLMTDDQASPFRGSAACTDWSDLSPPCEFHLVDQPEPSGYRGLPTGHHLDQSLSRHQRNDMRHLLPPPNSPQHRQEQFLEVKRPLPTDAEQLEGCRPEANHRIQLVGSPGHRGKNIDLRDDDRLFTGPTRYPITDEGYHAGREVASQEEQRQRGRVQDPNEDLHVTVAHQISLRHKRKHRPRQETPKCVLLLDENRGGNKQEQK